MSLFRSHNLLIFTQELESEKLHHDSAIYKGLASECGKYMALQLIGNIHTHKRLWPMQESNSKSSNHMDNRALLRNWLSPLRSGAPTSVTELGFKFLLNLLQCLFQLFWPDAATSPVDWFGDCWSRVQTYPIWFSLWFLWDFFLWFLLECFLWFPLELLWPSPGGAIST